MHRNEQCGYGARISGGGRANPVDAPPVQPSHLAFLHPFFAALPSSSPREAPQYKAWVAKLAKTEYADELVIAAVATEMKLRIVVVPWTPPEQERPFLIRSHPDRSDLPTIYLGNNDVHFVLLGAVKPVSDG